MHSTTIAETHNTTKKATRRALQLIAGATAIAVLAAACGSDADSSANGQAQTGAADNTAEQNDVEDASSDQATESDSDAETGAGILVEDGPTRFFELDWEIVNLERRPDGPTEDGADSDPTEDFVYVDIDVTSPLEDTSFSIPVEWLSLVDADGRGVRPVSASERATGDRISVYIDLQPNRTERLTAVFAVDSSDAFDGGWVELDQGDYLPAAFAGPQRMDEAARLPATFDTTTYSGSFSRDRATVEVIEAYWSRELGLEDDGALIDSPSNSSRRPPVGTAWLLVHFEVTCELTTINTGGCNVGSGEVVVDGNGASGSGLNGVTGYDTTDDYWAAYPVSVDATTVVVAIADGGTFDDDGKTAFAITDLAPLQSLATPAL